MATWDWVPSLHSNSAGPCGHIPVLDIFSKNIPSLQPPSCKRHWNRFLSTSEMESNQVYKAPQQYTLLMWLYYAEMIGSDNNGWPSLLSLAQKAVTKQALKKKIWLHQTNKGRRLQANKRGEVWGVCNVWAKQNKANQSVAEAYVPLLEHQVLTTNQEWNFAFHTSAAWQGKKSTPC